MNRRGFLRLIPGAAVTAAIAPLLPQLLPAAPPVKPAVDLGIRFVKSFDPNNSKMLNRFDVLYGYSHGPGNYSVRVSSDDYATEMARRLAESFDASIEQAYLES